MVWYQRPQVTIWRELNIFRAAGNHFSTDVLHKATVSHTEHGKPLVAVHSSDDELSVVSEASPSTASTDLSWLSAVSADATNTSTRGIAKQLNTANEPFERTDATEAPRMNRTCCGATSPSPVSSCTRPLRCSRTSRLPQSCRQESLASERVLGSVEATCHTNLAALSTTTTTCALKQASKKQSSPAFASRPSNALKATVLGSARSPRSCAAFYHASASEHGTEEYYS
jgi:hypothetical protein